MKKIGLLSDTHGYLDEAIFGYLQDCDEIWHAGDIGSLALAERLAAFKPLRAVHGNIDGQEVRQVYKANERFVCEGLTVWMTHIVGSPNRYNAVVRAAIAQERPDILVAGHSHILCVQRDPQGILYLNPGAAGLYGHHLVRTLLVFDIHEKTVSNVNAVVLGEKL